MNIKPISVIELGYVLNTGRAHSINFLIGYADGEAVNLETSPVEEHVLWPENGICVHTNHFLKPGKNFRDLNPLIVLSGGYAGSPEPHRSNQSETH